MRSRWSQPKTVAQVVALVLAVGAGVYLLIAPVNQFEIVNSSGDRESGATTLLQQSGPWMALVLLVPVVIVCVALCASSRFRQLLSALAALLMLVWCIAGAWSVGGAYMPALLLLVVAIFLAPRRAE